MYFYQDDSLIDLDRVVYIRRFYSKNESKPYLIGFVSELGAVEKWGFSDCKERDLVFNKLYEELNARDITTTTNSTVN